MITLNRTRRSRNKAMGVKQLTPSGGFVDAYTSQKAAALSTGIHINCINRVIKGHRELGGGYRWVTYDLPISNTQQRYVRAKKEVIEIKRYLSIVNRREVPQKRTCLFCGRLFRSKSPGNRRCRRCDSKVDKYGQEHLYSVHTDKPVYVGEFYNREFGF